MDDRPDSITRQLFPVLLIAYVLFWLWILRLDGARFVSLCNDDAFYYYKTAQNIVFNHISAFDGVNKSNGYHPLWMLILLPLFLAFKGGITAVKAVYILCLCLWVASAIVLFRVQRIHLSPYCHPELDSGSYKSYAIALFGTAFIINKGGSFMDGLETPLYLFLTICLFGYSIKEGVFTSTIDNRKAMVISLISSLIFLSRLDSAFILAAYLLQLIVVQIRLQGLRQVIRVFRYPFVLGLVLTLPYLIMNKIAFGNPLPISGRLKTAFPHLGFSFIYDGFFKRYFLKSILIVSSFTLIILLLSMITRYSKRYISLAGKAIVGDDYLFALIPLLIGNLIYLVYLSLYTRWELLYWYFAPIGLLQVLIIPYLLSILLNVFRKKCFAYAAIILSLLLSFLFMRRDLKLWGEGREDEAMGQLYKVAIWIKEHIPANKIMALKDSGAVGYFSELRVVNMDGLINNEEFQRAVYSDALDKYFDKNNVSLIAHLYNTGKDVLHSSYDTTRVGYFAILYGDRYITNVTLHREDEVFRSIPFIPSLHSALGDSTVFIIWKRR